MKIENKIVPPILLLTFNRPKETFIVFSAIRDVKPQKLFISSDGYRINKPNEKNIVEKLRNDIISKIDWECEVRTLFNDSNLGCKLAVSKAISWFFDSVESGIILEDDCLPNPSFFYYCSELLDKFKDEEKVMSICGYNVLGTFKSNKSYTFSNHFFSWGWASWRRAWNQRELEFESFAKLKNENKLKNIFPNRIYLSIRKKKYNDCIAKKVNSWAIPWNITHQVKSAFTIIPKYNLIQNIGFSNEGSTHTKENYWDNFFLNRKCRKIEIPLIHPSSIKNDIIFFYRFLIIDLIRILFKKISSKFIF